MGPPSFDELFNCAFPSAAGNSMEHELAAAVLDSLKVSRQDVNNQIVREWASLACWTVWDTRGSDRVIYASFDRPPFAGGESVAERPAVSLLDWVSSMASNCPEFYKQVELEHRCALRAASRSEAGSLTAISQIPNPI